MELRRARWIENLGHMTDKRAPRKILLSWTPHPRPTGRPQKTTRHALAQTIQNLGASTKLADWIPLTKTKQWARTVETNLNIKKGTYTPLALRI
jgi:hypothetical protein